MYDPREEEANREKANSTPKRENPCEASWGNCDPASPIYWGKPTATPHTCKGVRKHVSKLHVCETCQSVGHQIKPSPYSKAGAQLRGLIMASEGLG
jgi:hypothetical protein